MKKARFIFALFLLALLNGAAFAQRATVTGTINTAWAGASVTAIFVPQGGSTKPVPIQTSGALNSAGAFSLNGAWNNAYSGYTPSVTTFNFAVCANPTTTFSVTVAITSSSQDISSALASAPTPSCTGGGSTFNGGNVSNPIGAPSFLAGSPSTAAQAALPTGAAGLACDETSTAGVPATGVDYIRCDSLTHAILQSLNGAAETPIGSSSGSTTWPPSASGPTFSPAAGGISSGTTVTTSCSGGSPFISTGSTAVAGASGIVVSSPETLYGSCQGSGYFSIGSAAYTLSSTTTYINTVFNEASSGALAGTTPATCTNGCVGPWTLAGGTDMAYQGGGGVLGTTTNTNFDLINSGQTNETVRFNVSAIGTAVLGQIVLRYTDANNYLAINICAATIGDCGLNVGNPAGYGLFDTVGGTSTAIGTSVATTPTGNYTVVLSGTSVTVTGPTGSISATTANTGTKIGAALRIGPSFGLNSLSAKSQ